MSRTKQDAGPEDLVTADISGMGGRYTASFKARHVWDNTTGQLVKLEPDGLSYELTHPDLAAEGVSEVLSRAEVHERSFGASIPGGGSITRDGTVRDSKGHVLPRTTKPVGWNRRRDAEMPAVKIDGSLVLVSDLLAYAYEGQRAMVAPDRIPLGDDND